VRTACRYEIDALPQRRYGVASVGVALDTLAKWLIFHHNQMQDEMQAKLLQQAKLNGGPISLDTGMGSASQSLMKLLPASWKNAILDHPTVRQFWVFRGLIVILCGLQVKLYLSIFLSLVPLCAIVVGGLLMGMIEGAFVKHS
jgi:hypothetical protein